MKGPIYIQLPHFQNFANLCAVFKTDPDQAGKVLLEYWNVNKKEEKIKRQKNYSQKTNKHQDGANLDSPDLDTALLYTVMDNIRRS